MGKISPVNLRFGVVNTGDPRYLKLDDMSNWSFIEDKPARIEITLPATVAAVNFNWGKGQVNEFDAKILHGSCHEGATGDYLPDGIYKLTLIGTPETYGYTIYYLKTDNFDLSLDRILLDTDRYSDEFIGIVDELTFLKRAAEAHVKLENMKKADEIISQAWDLIERLKNCK
jgi:hypothetical protein